MNNYFFILSEQSKIVTLFCGWIFKARVEEEGIVLVNKCFVLYVLDDLVGFFFFCCHGSCCHGFGSVCLYGTVKRSRTRTYTRHTCDHFLSLRSLDT